MGAWGATALETGTVYIAPRVPCNRLRDVILHESVHVMQGRVYGGYDAASSGLAAYGGIEINADCGAKLLGASWTNYTSRCSAAQSQAARAILAGRRP